jgi:predicted Rossmann-fold nucleotide-binding protein
MTWSDDLYTLPANLPVPVDGGACPEIQSLAELEAYLAAGKPLAGCVFQDLDLTRQADVLVRTSLAGCIFLGCLLDPHALTHAQAEGALIFPRIDGLPYDPYRGACYTVDQLYEGYGSGGYEATLDSRIYKHFQATGESNPPVLREALARRLHDHSITGAVGEFLAGQKVVAFMGGHDLGRDTAAYRAVAEAARALRRKGFLIVTGGGPGAMEAAHLGAWLAPRAADGDLTEALKILAAAPLFTPVQSWLDTAFEVRSRYPLPVVPEPWSLGIPTWLYGHEPPNAFATQIAKYFENSLREAGLLAIAGYGVVFAPGSAGTIQEIFQNAAQNHYGTVPGGPSPMIFFGDAFWKSTKPVFPLLAELAAGQDYGRWLAITDDPAAIVALIEKYAAKKIGT